MENFWYKNLECADYDKLKAEVSKWVEPKVKNIIREQKFYFEVFLYKRMLAASPTFVRWLDLLGTGPINYAALVLTPPNFRSPIHTDTCPGPGLGINIGLQTKDTYTCLYDLKKGKPKLKKGGISTYYSYTDCVCEEHTRFDLTPHPIIFNAFLPHNVINPTDVWRVAITIRFEKDPWHLTVD